MKTEITPADLSEDIIPLSSDEYDRLYPIYERDKAPGQTFQQWLRARRANSENAR